MVKKAEVIEVEILTEEQINSLPEIVKENVTFLTKELSSKELVRLNPLVTELLTIRDLEKELDLMPLNSEGKFNKENIAEYKSLKAKIRSFNASTGKELKSIKEPFLKVQKGFVAIEKALKSEAMIVAEVVTEKFQTYEDAQILLAQERQKKKDAVLLAEIEKEKEASASANMQLEKSNLYNKIKYDIVNSLINEKATEIVANGNEDSIKSTAMIIIEREYTDLTKGLNIAILDETIILELKEYFVKSKENALKILKSRLDTIRIEKENIALEAQKRVVRTIDSAEDIAAIEIKPIAPPPPTFTNIPQCVSNIEFADFKDSRGNLLEDSRAWKKLKELIAN